MDGIFKWYNSEKGYGFIVGEDSKDYFVHYSALPQGQETIKEEQDIKVTFEAKETQRGIQAESIVFVEGGESEEASSEDNSDEE